jgi:hypothetical protein
VPVLALLLAVVVIGSAVAGPVLAVLGALAEALAVAARVAEVAAIVAAPALVAGLGFIVYVSVALGRADRAFSRARLAAAPRRARLAAPRPAPAIPSPRPSWTRRALAERQRRALPAERDGVLTGQVLPLPRRRPGGAA